jgi:hypothetical protein
MDGLTNGGVDGGMDYFRIRRKTKQVQHKRQREEHRGVVPGIVKLGGYKKRFFFV